jgi:hypothetical protein
MFPGTPRGTVRLQLSNPTFGGGATSLKEVEVLCIDDHGNTLEVKIVTFRDLPRLPTYEEVAEFIRQFNEGRRKAR